MARPVFTAELRVANLCTYDHAAPGRHATLAYSLTGGNLLAWFRDQWCRTEVRAAAQGQRDAFTRILDDLPAEPSGLLVLPYFTPSGTPYFDRTTPGAILGLRLSTSRQQVLRGLLEGVAMEMRLNLALMRESGLEVHTLRAVGGGARSTAWLQLKADVTGRVIERVEVTEAGCLGVAMLAYAALSGHSVEDLAQRWIRTSNHMEPTPSISARYAEAFERYRRLQPALNGLRLFDD
jgi:xylulokinase